MTAEDATGAEENLYALGGQSTNLYFAGKSLLKMSRIAL